MPNIIVRMFVKYKIGDDFIRFELYPYILFKSMGLLQFFLSESTNVSITEMLPVESA